jgi:hypothetical protein
MFKKPLLKRRGFFSKKKVMKEIKYELIKITKAVGANAIYNEFLKETDPNYSYITGILFVKYSGDGTNIRLGISNTAGSIINMVPVDLLDIDSTVKGFEEYFIPMQLDARGETIKALLQATTITTEFIGDVVLRLENKPRNNFNFNLQHKRIEFAKGLTTYETADIIIDSNYKAIRGIWVNGPDSARVGVKANGDYQVNLLPTKILETTNKVDYMLRFYPCNFKAKSISVVTELIAASSQETIFDIVFLLEK